MLYEDEDEYPRELVELDDELSEYPSLEVLELSEYPSLEVLELEEYPSLEVLELEEYCNDDSLREIELSDCELELFD